MLLRERTKGPGCGATTALGAVLLVSGFSAPAGADGPDVEEIVARYVEARGGLEAMRAIETLVYSGGLYQEADFSSSGNAMMAFERPYYRVVGNPEDPGGYMEGYDGASWEWLGDPGIVVRTVGAAAGATRRGADFEGMLVDYRSKGSTVELGDAETIDGRPTHRLMVTLRDGFVRELFVDQETYLTVAERRSAPFHAFGDPVTSETRIGDYRPAIGSTVLFAHSYVQTEIATGKELSRMQWGRVEANRELPRSWFSPPAFERTPLQRFLEQLYGQRTDVEAVMWSYREFLRAHPEIDVAAGIEAIGYQMLKMGDVDAAVALLEANAAANPESSSAAFGLGRALATAGRPGAARRQLERALALDADNQRASRALADLEADAPPDNPLGFLAAFIGSWGPDPEAPSDGGPPPDFVAFRFEWADPARKLLRFYEGIPQGDLERRILENLVTFDPRSGEIVALGYQLRNDYLYRSTFEPAERGYVRDYRVTYPPEQVFQDERDRARGWIRYRDRCELIATDRLHCVTEQMKDGDWTVWGSPDGYTLVRR